VKKIATEVSNKEMVTEDCTPATTRPVYAHSSFFI